ncbi:MAG: sulfatase-like hydrolase/transferase, partial [Opitutaceae bacterium]|nr:sulfatase-like hydrolase/transferase [Opitutaceae bacterium]
WLPPDLASLGGTAHQHLPGYCAMIKRLDEAFGRVLDALRSLDLLDDTIILFTSDHGSHFKTRNSEYKRSCHESSVHIPAAARGPGFDGGGEIRELVSLVDFAPSLLDAAGLEIPSEMVGKSVMPLTKGDSSDWPDSVFIQISEEQVGRAIRTSRWKYSVVAEGIDGRTEAGADTYTEEFLYDLKADPYELENLVGEEAYEELRVCLRERLLRSIRGIENREVTIKPAIERESHYARQLTEKEMEEVSIEHITVRGSG